jgi:hypothetical protein
VLCWQFHYDFHRTGRAYLKDERNTGPWVDFEKPGRHTHHVSDRSVFPLRSLIPEKMDGLLGVQKKVGFSSIVCAAIRLHDQCIAIGGVAAVVALRNDIQPREIPYNRIRLEEVRHGLCGEGADSTPLQLWPFRDLPADHSAFVAINRLAARGMLPQEPTEVDFNPDATATAEWVAGVNVATAANIIVADLPDFSASKMTRGEFCIALWEAVNELKLVLYQPLSRLDADSDGIPDRDDPTPFTPAKPVVWKIERPAVKPPSPEHDGLPDDLATSNVLVDAEIRQFNFTGKGSKPVSGFDNDNGLRFESKRGSGWAQDISKNNRRRSVYDEEIRDTFLFSREFAKWECEVPNGKWLVTICNGDSGHEQTGHQVSFEGKVAVKNVPTAAGHFAETTATVEVSDGRLTMNLGPQLAGSNTCVNWLRLAPFD